MVSGSEPGACNALPALRAGAGRPAWPLGRAALRPAAALTAAQLIREAHRDGRLKLPPREVSWLDRMQKAIEAIPASELEFITEMMAEVDTTKFVAGDYGL